MISYEPPNDTGDNDHDHDRDPDQLAKLQEKASSQLLLKSSQLLQMIKSFQEFLQMLKNSAHYESHRFELWRDRTQLFGKALLTTRSRRRRKSSRRTTPSWRAGTHVIHHVFFLPYNTCKKSRISF